MSYWISLIGTCIYFVVIASCIGVILSENRNPIRSLAWVIALLALPGIGLVFYLFFGRSLKGRYMISRHGKRKLLHNFNSRHVDLNALDMPADLRQIVKLAYNLNRAPLTLHNEIKIFTEGAEKFHSLVHDLRNARKSIYLQYYIFANDTLGKAIGDILIQKASEGVDVKVIYDHVGSFSFTQKFWQRLRNNGVDVHPFFRVTFPTLANRINWRNHRKIVIIDNETGYIGGMNIADRYISGYKSDDVWRDTHFRLKGDIIQSLIYSFAVDWYFMKNPDNSLQLHDLAHSYPRPDHNLPVCPMQLVTAGPVDPRENLALCFLKAISSATKSIYIQTPYFLPTDALMNALEAAALSKIDIRIMIPSHSDSKLLTLATYSYITRCLKAGIKVYLYTPGMLHAKCMIIDEGFVTAGSTNFDFRSFENNFESNLLIYSAEINAHMRDIFFTDLRECEKLKYSEWRRRPVLQRSLESLLRLFAPIL